MPTSVAILARMTTKRQITLPATSLMCWVQAQATSSNLSRRPPAASAAHLPLAPRNAASSRFLTASRNSTSVHSATILITKPCDSKANGVQSSQNT